MGMSMGLGGKLRRMLLDRHLRDVSLAESQGWGVEIVATGREPDAVLPPELDVSNQRTPGWAWPTQESLRAERLSTLAAARKRVEDADRRRRGGRG